MIYTDDILWWHIPMTYGVNSMTYHRFWWHITDSDDTSQISMTYIISYLMTYPDDIERWHMPLLIWHITDSDDISQILMTYHRFSWHITYSHDIYWWPILMTCPVCWLMTCLNYTCPFMTCSMTQAKWHVMMTCVIFHRSRSCFDDICNDMF